MYGTADLLICENITKTYKSKKALDSVSLVLEKGKIYGLIGRNGAGKTTLLSVLSAQSPPSRGNVVLETEKGRLLSICRTGTRD